MENSLFKSFGVLWKPFVNRYGELQLENTPYCPNEGCRTSLAQNTDGWYCLHCDKTYPTKHGFREDEAASRLKFKGFQIKDLEVYSLDLPPTKVAAKDEDDSYWIEARITEKGGKKIGVVYFGEKTKGKQESKDYSQVFVELENDEIRFDKNNANPKKLLARLEAEFKDTKITQIVKEN